MPDKIDKIVKLNKALKLPNKGLVELKNEIDITKYNVLVQDKKEGKTYLLDSSELNSGGGDSGLESIVAGDNITIDDTDPQNPIISATGTGGGGTSIAFSKNGTGIASQSGLNLIEGTGVTITGVNDPTNGRVNYTLSASGQSITEGAPTQADRASVDITVLNTDYNQLIGTQLKFGTVPNQQIFEFYPRDGTEPSSPIIGVDMAYNPATNSFHALGSTLGIQDGDTITINGRTYTWQLVLTNVNNHVQLGITDSDSIQNMIDAINLTGTPGTQYASAMTINADVSASSNLTVTANIPGTGGNSITTTASISSGDYDWSNPTLVDGDNPTNSDVADDINNIIERYSMLADNKLMSSTKSGNTVTVYSVRPGTYGNGISIDSTNDTAVTPSSSTTSGGLNNGTTGSIGALRKGVVEVIHKDGNIKIDSLFTAISDNVWMITSSTNNNIVGSAYYWTNI